MRDCENVNVMKHFTCKDTNGSLIQSMDDLTKNTERLVDG